MKILGIDPGTAIVGFGVISYENRHYQVLDVGVIRTKSELSDAERLEQIYSEIKQIIQKNQPDLVCVESLFYFKNQNILAANIFSTGLN